VSEDYSIGYIPAFDLYFFYILGSVPDVVGKRKQTSDIDRGGNIDLKCTMQGQAGIIINWYRNDDLIEESKSVKLKSKDVGNNRVQSTLSLYNVTINENGAKYECRGRYPGVSLLQYASFPVLLRVGGKLIELIVLL
jgi:hypothetical protein